MAKIVKKRIYWDAPTTPDVAAHRVYVAKEDEPLTYDSPHIEVDMPVTEVFIMTQAPGKHRSKIFGIYYSTMQYTGAIFVLPGGYFLERYGFDTMFTWAAIGVTIVAVITSLLIFDAKDHYQAETQT